MSDDTVLYERKGSLAILTLNRPDRFNAISTAMIDDIIARLDQADADDQVRAVIVTANGRHFCAGADMSSDAFSELAHPAGNGAFRDPAGRLTLRLHRNLKPVIGAIHGAAIGIGATITLAMDARLASTDVRFGFAFTRRGISPEGASTWFLTRLVGLERALDWCLTGRTLPADEALDARLVRSLHAPEDLLAAAEAYATEVVEHTAPVAVAVTRRLLWRMAALDDPEEAHQAESRILRELLTSADAREGVASFQEKRPANFPDRVSDLKARGLIDE